MQGKIWNYTDEPDPSRNGQTMPWMAGKILGGGSSVNGMVWVRGNAADFDEWADARLRGLGLRERAALLQEGRTLQGRR